MKTIYLLLGVVCALLPISLCAQDLKDTDANVVGHVIDKKTNKHMPYIRVALRGTTLMVATDATGHYFLKDLPEGEFTLEVSAVGYKTETRRVRLKKGKTLEENFLMEEGNVELEGVVVSANRNETRRKMAPTLINVMDAKMFESTNSNTLSEGLNFQPGIRVENNCQNCGFQQVRINGLDGPYTQILVDSCPVFSALAGVYGLEQIPANMIERVEVMRGGGSALFGSSAIAGTINIITKEPTRNSGEVAHSTMGVGGMSRFDHNTTLNMSLITDDHKAGIYVFGQNRERSGYDHDGDGFTELPELSSRTIGLRSFLKTGLYSKLSVEYHNMQEFRRGGNKLSRPAHEADITEQVDHNIHCGGLKYDWFAPAERARLSLFASAQHVDRKSYYGGGQDPDAYGATSDLTWVVGAQGVYSFRKFLFMPSDLTAGVEYNQDHLKDDAWGYDRYTDQNVRIASAFLQNEWKNDRWSFLVGGRLDKHSLMDHLIFSPRANVRFNPTENISIRGSYSFGFRAPQAFDEDLHIANVGGTVSVIELADDLSEEKSQSFSLSADMYHRWGDWQGNLLVEGFYTELSDVFALRKLGLNDDGILVNERYNESGARVLGLTLEGKLAYRDLLQFQAGMTFQQAKYKEARSWDEEGLVPMKRRMFRTPDTYGYATLTYTPTKPLKVSLSGVYTGNMLVEHWAGYIPEDRTEKTPDFFELNLKASYDFKLYKQTVLQLNAGIQNLFDSYQDDFDQGSDRDSGYIYGPGLPRSFFAGLKVSF